MKRGMTTEQFVARSFEQHGSFYDYTLVEYKTTKAKVEIKCPIHDVFLQQPIAHMRGQGCPGCHKDKQAEASRKSKEEKDNRPKTPRGNPFKNKTAEEMEVMAKKKRTTNVQRYGVDNPSQADSIKQKKLDTVRKNYGVDNPMYSEEVKKKLINTNLERYGVENPAQSARVIEKTHATNQARYGMHPAKLQKNKDSLRISQLENGYKKLQAHLPEGTIIDFDFDEYRGYHNQQDWHPYPFVCTQCDTRFIRKLIEPKKLICPTCRIPNYVSKAEQDIVDFLRSNGIECEQSNKQIIGPFELDIVIHSHKIAIEYCGLYWHSELAGVKSKNYHRNKQEQAAAAGYRLITIFEDEWRYKRDIVITRLKHQFGLSDKGVGARKLSIREIEWTDAKEFLNTYHIQGAGSPGFVRYGAFYEDSLVAMMSFSKPRRSMGRSSGALELLRFVTDGKTYPGVASRLFNQFVKDTSPDSIISYADKRWSDGGLYTTLGFSETDSSDPNYWYMSNYAKREYRYKYRKSELIEHYEADSNKTEWENMKEMGYDRIWDCGNLKFVWNAS